MMRPTRAAALRPTLRRPALQTLRRKGRPRRIPLAAVGATARATRRVTTPGRTTAPDLLPQEVLRIVRSHPEGVCAVDAGNELGINWRRVLAAMRTLVQAGELEQVQEQFYAVGKASRK